MECTIQALKFKSRKCPMLLYVLTISNFTKNSLNFPICTLMPYIVGDPTLNSCISTLWFSPFLPPFTLYHFLSQSQKTTHLHLSFYVGALLGNVMNWCMKYVVPIPVTNFETRHQYCNEENQDRAAEISATTLIPNKKKSNFYAFVNSWWYQQPVNTVHM
jgi:hypothetical protein